MGLFSHHNYRCYGCNRRIYVCPDYEVEDTDYYCLPCHVEHYGIDFNGSVSCVCNICNHVYVNVSEFDDYYCDDYEVCKTCSSDCGDAVYKLYKIKHFTFRNFMLYCEKIKLKFVKLLRKVI